MVRALFWLVVIAATASVAHAQPAPPVPAPPAPAPPEPAPPAPAPPAPAPTVQPPGVPPPWSPPADAPRPHRRFGYPHPRADLGFVGTSMGGSLATIGLEASECPGCQHAAEGFGLSVRAGFNHDDHLALLVDLAFSGRDLDDPAGRFTTVAEMRGLLGARYWLGKRPWLQAGVGYGLVRYGGKGATTRPPVGWQGAAASVGAGYEIFSRDTLTIAIVADASVTIGAEQAALASLSLSLDWWFLDLHDFGL